MTLHVALSRLLWPLRSRKFRVALATVIASVAAAWGLELREDVVYTILGVGAALILGIAHEDAARPVPADAAADRGTLRVRDSETEPGPRAGGP